MSDITWTDEQKSAIRDRSGTLLVSAAAGSGKTAVLTQRIIELIKGGDADISRLLVVTFTRASASDLKQKLTQALNKELSADPDNKHLRRQQLAVGRARISTIDSFFNEIVRSGFQKLGLPADFGILDEAENSMLMRGVLEELLDVLYEDDAWKGDISSEMFYRTVEALIGGRDDTRLADTLHSLYLKCISMPKPFSWLEDEAVLLGELADSPEPMDTSYGSVLKDYIKDFLDTKLGFFPDAMAEVSDEPFASRYGDYFTYLDEYLSSLTDTRTYDALRDKVSSFTPPRLKNKKKDSSDVSDFLDMVKDKAGDAADRLSEVIAPQHLLCKAAEDTREVVVVLTEILKRYDRALSAEKLRRARLSFSDLSRYALKLLLEEKDGEWVPTSAAKELSEELDGIFVDEYQDTNRVQDMIFRALDRGGRRFMVGDVKQSIYRFRGAVPEIFANYMHSFPINGDGRVLTLPHNFRSTSPVLDFCNHIFSSLFSEQLGGVDYSDGHKLCLGNQSFADGKNDYPAQLYLVDGAEEDEEEDSGYTLPAQATFTAERIKRLLEEEDENGDKRYKPEDVAILVRSTPNVLYFQRALEAAGIPCRSEKSENFLECPEVLIALSLLQVIDNPMRDIYLAGALRSPVFGMKLGELIELRGEGTGGTLYDALTARATAGDSASTAIVGRMERWRTAARALPVDKLIRRIYEDTGLPEIASGAEKGGVRHVNLMLLYQSARSFESTSYKGLYSFLEYIDDAMKGQTRIESARLDTGEGAVSVMTIHKSKGLQFKVCVLADAARRFNRSDSTSAMVTHESLGASFKLPDITGMGRVNTPMRLIASHYADKQSVSEEARVLYVALTRAVERLIICGQTRDAVKYIEKAASLPLSGSAFFSCTSMMDWMCSIILRDKTANPLREHAGLKPANEDSGLKLICGIGRAVSPKKGEVVTEEIQEADADYMSAIKERFDFIYGDGHLTHLPSKLSVSRLHPSALDSPVALLDRPSQPPRPSFMLAKHASAADVGIAMHTFMQFCDFLQSAREGCAKQAEVLLKKRFLTSEAVGLLDFTKLDAFFRSPLYADISSADEVYRELRFNLNLPACEFTCDKALKAELLGQNLLVQGVVDLFYRKGDTWHVVDFKTDSLYSSITEQELIDRHGLQLSYYVRAVRELCGAAQVDACVYSFALGRTVAVMG